MLGVNNYNNSPKFKMTLKLDSSATPIIKKQALKLGEKGKNNFLANIQQINERQQNNPVDIIIRKTKHRNALAAEVVDAKNSMSNGENVKNQVFTQPFIFKNGSLRFLNKAEKKANKINETNNQIDALKGLITEAKPEDYRLKSSKTLDTEV